MKHVLPFSPLAALVSPLPNSSQFALGLHLPAGFPVPALCKAQHLDPPPPRLASICLVLGQLTSWTSKLSRRRTSLVNEIVFFFCVFFEPPSQDGIESRARGETEGACEVRARSRRPTAPSKAIGFGKSLLPCPTEPHGTVRWTSKSFCERSAGWWPSTIGPEQRFVPWPCPSLSRDFELSSLGLVPDYGLPDPPPSAVPGEDL